MKGSEFVFDYIDLLYYEHHDINSNCAGSYIDSLDWIRNKKSTINSINKFSMCCNIALNREEVKKYSQRINKS